MPVAHIARRRMAVGALAVICAAGCAADEPDVAATMPATRPPSSVESPATTIAPVTEPSQATSTTAPRVTTTTEPRVELPTGIVFAVPTQNREDVAKSQFQVQVHNATKDRFDVASVQFVWQGFTTQPSAKGAIYVGGQAIDLPVAFPGATCVGDGSQSSMPPLDDATVVMQLIDGRQLVIPVIDQWHLARRLYLDNCERQMIESQVAIEWVDLREADFEGRPVTAGQLRLTRRDSTGAIVVKSIGNTIPYVVDVVGVDGDDPVLTLAEGQASASIDVHFVESRCDPHALAEVKQPTKFVAQILTPDGIVHPYIAYPDRDYWTQMRLTADKGCIALGKVEWAGQS